MSTPAVRDHQSPLEAALLDVHATLGELLVAADEQYSAVADRDRELLESVTRRQEQLAMRLERAERRRIQLQSQPGAEGQPPTALARITVVRRAIARRVRELQLRNARASSLLQRTVELNAQTLNFLHRLAAPEAPT
jgi:flagellar biosynthesis/type III secretory pathway chaperone